MDLKKLMTGANPQSIMLEQTRGLKAKWEKTGLLENSGTETNKHGMAVLLENQAKQLWTNQLRLVLLQVLKSGLVQRYLQ